MRYLDIDGAKVSVIGLGTWQFGSKEWGYGADFAEREAPAIVKRALDLGVTLIDTAQAYGFGRSEKIVGKAICGRREGLFVATKFLPVLPVAPMVARQARGSAARLGVEEIDLYQAHWPNPAFPTGMVMRALRPLQDAGLVRHIGVSNFSLKRWAKAERVLGRPVLTNQVRYNLVARDPENDLIPYAEQAGRLIIAYSPLGKGLLSGGYNRDKRPSDMVRKASPMFRPEALDRVVPLAETLRDVARAHDATSAQVALAWVVRKPCVIAIPGASSVAQLEANAAAADLDLSEEEVTALNETSAAVVAAGH
jgi:aryl-alcohol dehydrogenase-like predicted oxidoreductase